MTDAATVTRPRAPRLAVVALVFSAGTVVPFPMVGGLIGSLLGAIAGVSARRSHGRFSPTLADIAVGVGLFFGTPVMLVFTALHVDEWGVAPLVLTVAHVAIVSGLFVFGWRGGASGAVGGAAIGVAAAVGFAVFAVGVVLAVAFMFSMLFSAA